MTPALEEQGLCCALSSGPSHKRTQLLCFDTCSRLDGTKIKGLKSCERGGYSHPLASVNCARRPLPRPQAHRWLQRDGPSCSALLGEFSLADAQGRGPAPGRGCIRHWGCEDASRVSLRLGQRCPPQSWHYSPSARAPRHGATQRGIPELPGSLAAPGLTLCHSVFWETIVGF